MSEPQKPITIVSAIPFEDVKGWLEYSMQKGNTNRAILCIYQNTKLTLTARLYDVRGYQFFFSLFLYRGDEPIFGSDANYTVKGVIEAFTTFAGNDEDVQFYVATNKKDK